GRLTRGLDGHFYPVGLDRHVRVQATGNELVAYLEDGARWTFGGAARVVTANGTYSWNLRETRDRLGNVTILSWTANDSGNLFLTQVDYGGRETPQYRIDLVYEPVLLVDSNGLTRPKFVDYRSGSPLTLDRRVNTVRMLVRRADTGDFHERYRYVLGYTDEP